VQREPVDVQRGSSGDERQIASNARVIHGKNIATIKPAQQNDRSRPRPNSFDPTENLYGIATLSTVTRSF